MRAFNRSASCDFLDAACSKSLRYVGTTQTGIDWVLRGWRPAYARLVRG